MFDEESKVGDVDVLMARLHGVDERFGFDGHECCCVDRAHSHSVIRPGQFHFGGHAVAIVRLSIVYYAVSDA